MKELHHPGTPCKIVTQKDYDLSMILENNLELVRCSEGWGVFGKGEYWVSDEEQIQLNNYKKIKVFDPEKIHLRDWGFYSPINLEIELTKKCNQRCVHCWNESGNNSFIPIKKLEEIVSEFRFNGGQKLKLTGGEPLMHPSFFEFLDYAKKQGIKKIELTTNGTFIDDNTSQNLSKYLDKINISLHGATKETQDYITQTKNYNKTINAIDRCKSNGINTIINFTVMKENEEEIEDLFRIAEDKFVRIRFNLLMQSGSGRNLSDISDKVIPLRNKIFFLSKKYNVSLERSELYPEGYNEGIKSSKFYGCSALRTGMYISSDGLVLPCNLASNPIGNIYEKSIQKIWNGEKADEIRKITSCKTRKCGFSCSGKCQAEKI